LGQHEDGVVDDDDGGKVGIEADVISWMHLILWSNVLWM
jgi:hypothetical protein